LGLECPSSSALVRVRVRVRARLGLGLECSSSSALTSPTSWKEWRSGWSIAKVPFSRRRYATATGAVSAAKPAVAASGDARWERPRHRSSSGGAPTVPSAAL
jgi:hypothetical protein